MIDDNRPPSVRLGEVVPPEDPEDWGQPLTWIVAGGMLVGPIVGAAWFLLAAPADPSRGGDGHLGPRRHRWPWERPSPAPPSAAHGGRW